MIRIEKMTSCTIDEAVQAWNDGFEGYYFNAATTPEAFLKRMVAEDLSPALTLLAFDGNQPVGIIMHGTRTVQGSCHFTVSPIPGKRTGRVQRMARRSSSAAGREKRRDMPITVKHLIRMAITYPPLCISVKCFLTTLIVNI
ncbi:hypothetical protein ACE41H_03570 [Paenibacillus enshidis]|uniref:N-acetyltransferase domain-containing protein n=1 Tax=Paenibacillus enshidis TaxID=1458439 RepID=A0ABV5ANU6_9BACL